MKASELLDRSLKFAAGVLREPTGQPSAGRVVLVMTFYTAAVAIGVFVVRRPDLAKDLIEFCIPNALAVYGVNKYLPPAKADQ